MANKNTYKCRCCGKEIEKDKALKDDNIQRVYYCSLECKKIGLKSVDAVNHYMYQKFGIKNITFPIIKKQYDKMIKEGYKHSGIMLTLYYCCDIIETEIDPSLGIYFVPYYYEDAKHHYERIKKNQELAKTIQDNDVIYIDKNNNIPLSLLKYKYNLKRGK